MGERLRALDLELKLLANNKEIQIQSGGMSTDMKGITFHKEYDALPEKLQALKLKLVSFSADHDVNKVIDLNKNLSKQKFNINGQDIIVNKVYKKNKNTMINITTEENTILSKIYLLVDDKKVELNRTIKGDYDKLKSGTILYTRALEFNEIGERNSLDIKSMTYSKKYDKTIEIPIE